MAIITLILIIYLQAIQFECADKANDPDPMSWAPTISAIPTGLMFPDLNGNARLDLMWSIPTQVGALRRETMMHEA